MNLIIFDIDGTLTDTYTLDADFYLQSVRKHSPIQHINTDWRSYKYSTDSGILQEIFQMSLQRDPHHEEINNIRDQFAHFIKEAHQQDNAVISPIPGATEIFDKINNLPNWHIGIATGGWRKTALFKLNSAQIPHAHIQKAYADDHVARSEIIKVAIERCKTFYSTDEYEKIIYVGDAEWDLRAANKLGIGFVGVGERFVGRDDVFAIENYANDEVLLEHLDELSIV